MHSKRISICLALLLSVVLSALPVWQAPALAQSPTPTRTAGATRPAAAASAAPAAANTPAPAKTPAPTGTTVAREPSKQAAATLPDGIFQQLIGNCGQARKIFAAILQSGTQGPVAAEANFRMAQCYMHDDAPSEAFATLKDLLATAPAHDPHRAPAQFLLGETLSSLGAYKQAEAAYQAHLPLTPELQYLTWQRIAAQRQAQGNMAGAAEAYRQALAKSPDWTNTSAIRRALADVALKGGNAKEAVTQYDALRGSTTKGAFASEMQYLAGNALAQAANAVKATGVLTPTYPADALKRWQAAVDADPTSEYAHSSIVALLNAGALVDEFQRGVANYSNGIYDLAIAAFDRLREAEPDGRQGLAWYYAGLSYTGAGQYDRGVQELDTFMSRWPNSAQWADAAMARARALGRAGRTSDAIAAYRELAQQKPDAAQAPKALYQAALLLANSSPDQAPDAYLDLAHRYPAADEGWRAYYAAGMAFFRKAEWRRAAEIWGEMAAAPNLAAFARPVGYYWQGRALHAAGDAEAAKRAWEAGKALGESYYGLRSAAWLDGKPETWVREDVAKTEVPTVKAGDEKADIGAWLKQWAGQGSLNLPVAVTTDPNWKRGQALLAIGRRTEALLNFERVRKAHEKEPWTLTALAIAFRDAGANRLSLLSAEAVISMRGQPLRETPVALQKLAYPFPYEKLIRQEAARQKLDPRLLAAVIRQESRFEPGVASSAGAQGLMQVMPGTATGIARQMAWPGYEDEQAYWPYVNVAFGAFYVRQWLSHFDGSHFAALAAYNAGPGNAGAWWEQAPNDDDLFAGLININETRVYVQTVWQNYEFYRRLYPR
ncbi:MAG: transglycosylase SLT domain-containing protein [Nitrososphaerales archaeon]